MSDNKNHIIERIDREQRKSQRIVNLEDVLHEIVKAWCNPGFEGTAEKMPKAMYRAIALLRET